MRMVTENTVTENMKMKEREISLLDLLVELLLHWRMVLVAMLLGGIVLGGFSYVRSSQNAKRQQQAAEKAHQDWEQQQGLSREELMEQWEAQGVSLRGKLDDAQLERVNTAFSLRQRWDERFDYQQHSLLMQLNPMKIQQADLIFWVSADDMEEAYIIANVYERLLAGATLHEYVENKCGIDCDVSEIITLTKPGYDVEQVSNYTLEERVNAVSVQILHDDADTCSAMADAVEEFIRLQQKELERTLGNHEVILLSRTQREVTDKKVADLQSTCANTLYSLSVNYSALKKSFVSEELAYYNYLVAGSPADSGDAGAQENEAVQGASAPETVVAKAGISVKYVLLGIILFAGIYFFALFVKYIMNSRLRSADSLCELYGIPQLGTVSALSQKRFLGVVDQWILKLRYHNQRRFTPEESVGLAAVAVKMAALKRGDKAVCLLGCELKGNTLEICGQIKGQLEAAGLKVNTLSNVLYDAEAMEQLGGVGSVVLVETAGVTLYDEILKELELLRRQEITVLGGIVMEQF